MLKVIKKYPELGTKSENVFFKITKTKNIRIAIKSDLQITVSFSRYCSLKKAQTFFESKLIWAYNSLQTLAQRQKIHNQKEQQIFPKLSAEEFLAKNHYLILRCRQLAQIHNFSPRKIILRRQKTLWGSCSVENNISLNANLVFLKDELIDYVILHELVHTKVKNHSRKFWEELEKILPGSRALNRELKNIRPHLDQYQQPSLNELVRQPKYNQLPF
ncbi:MAG: M48 family metallopeptidase [Pseudomonadota bacterium]